MKRHLWVVETSDSRNGPWFLYYVCQSRSFARWMRPKGRQYRRIVKYVSESTAGSAGTTKE